MMHVPHKSPWSKRGVKYARGAGQTLPGPASQQQSTPSWWDDPLQPIYQQVTPYYRRLNYATEKKPYVGLMLGQRLRRWPNIKPTQGQYILIVGQYTRTWQTSSKPTSSYSVYI